MKTKKDYWITILIAYLFIFSGIVLLLITQENENPHLLFLFIVILLEVIGLVVTGRALKIYRTLEDKSIYPKQLDFLNKLASKLYSDKKTSNKVVIIALIFGGLMGVIIGLRLF